MTKKKNVSISEEDIQSDSELEEQQELEDQEELDEVSNDERISELEDSLLRLRAELDNSQKRSITEVENAHKYGVERLLLELLPVVDNLEHALKNLSDGVSKSDKEGVELTLKSFEFALDKFGISPIYPINEVFDPIQHEAVSVKKDAKQNDNKIVEVLQKGWNLHERTIRPARVVVVKN